MKPSSISRRDALRRGAIVAGGLWVVPTVHVLGLSPASAQQVSGPPSDSIPPNSTPPTEAPHAPPVRPVVPPGASGSASLSPTSAPVPVAPAGAEPGVPVIGRPTYVG